MKSQFLRILKSTAILSVVFGFALNMAWAVDYYSNSVTVPYGKKGNSSMTLIKDGGQDKVEITIKKHTLEPYMDEMGINSVTITADLEIQWIDDDLGGRYQMDFTFGPSGAFFEPKPLEIFLKGKYHSDRNDVWLFDENGEALDGERNNHVDHTVLYVNHFSSYSYDHYDY